MEESHYRALLDEVRNDVAEAEIAIRILIPARRIQKKILVRRTPDHVGTDVPDPYYLSVFGHQRCPTVTLSNAVRLLKAYVIVISAIRYGFIQGVAYKREYVFRFPKRPEIARGLLKEIRILPALAAQMPLRVPSFDYVWHGGPQYKGLFVGYPRIPGVPLTSELIESASYDDLMNLGMEAHSGYVQLGEEPLQFEVKESMLTQMMNLEPVDLPTTTLSDIHVLPCLAQAAMGEGNPTHRERYHFATYLADRLRMFFPHWRIDEREKEEHIRTICSFIAQQGWVDYDTSRTEEQVRSIVATGYSSATCATLYQEGYCVGKCVYYDGTGGI